MASVTGMLRVVVAGISGEVWEVPMPRSGTVADLKVVQRLLSKVPLSWIHLTADGQVLDGSTQLKRLCKDGTLIVRLSCVISVLAAWEPFEVCGETRYHHTETGMVAPSEEEVRAASASPEERLCLAAWRGDVEEAIALCRAGTPPDAPMLCWCLTRHCRRTCTALWLAMGCGSVEVVRLLCTSAADVGKTDEYGECALYAGVWLGRLEAIRCLHEEFGAALTRRNKEGRSLLHAAAHHGQATVVAYILQHGGDVHCMDRAGWTALHAAALGHSTVWRDVDHPRVVAALAAVRADVNAKASDGTSALYVAVCAGCVPVVRSLLEAAAAPDQAREDGASPILAARRSRDMYDLLTGQAS